MQTGRLINFNKFFGKRFFLYGVLFLPLKKSRQGFAGLEFISEVHFDGVQKTGESAEIQVRPMIFGLDKLEPRGSVDLTNFDYLPTIRTDVIKQVKDGLSFVMPLFGICCQH
jgi:hypothetical protein